MIDSKTTFLLKWAGFEKKIEGLWKDGKREISASTSLFNYKDYARNYGDYHESTPENLNRDLQNFIRKYMRDQGIEPPPKLSRAQERILIREINGEYQMVTFRQAEDLCTKGIMDGSFLPKLTAKGRIMAEYLKEKV